jgi:hypothetical protein
MVRSNVGDGDWEVGSVEGGEDGPGMGISALPTRASVLAKRRAVSLTSMPLMRTVSDGYEVDSSRETANSSTISIFPYEEVKEVTVPSHSSELSVP